VSSDQSDSPAAGFKTVGLLPWLPLQEPLAFGGVRFEPLSAVAPRLPTSEKESVRLVGATFGRDADPGICWPETDGDVPTFAEPDVTAIHDRVRLLTVAAISGNEYFTIDTPANAAHFEVVFQRFTPGAESFAIEHRRRDGQTLSGGHRYRETRFHRPQATFGRTRIRWDRDLLDALKTCLGGNDSLSMRIRQSSVAFAAANRLDDFSSFEAEVVWAATALEQLLRREEKSYFSTLVTDILASPHTTPGGERMLRRWSRELYAQRSEVHGKPAKTDHWSHGWHAMLATMAYGVCVKQLLAGAGRLELNRDDEVEAMAFPWRVAWLRQHRLPPVGDVGAAWHRARDRASWRYAHLGFMAMLREQA
jgi:hypothetical protein